MQRALFGHPCCGDIWSPLMVQWCAGNVARFMNHACTGSNNVFPRAVLVEGSTGLWYKVTLMVHSLFICMQEGSLGLYTPPAIVLSCPDHSASVFPVLIALYICCEPFLQSVHY